MLGQLGYDKNTKVSSPASQYVAMMNKSRFDGYYFRVFNLPEDKENNCQVASHYYMNELDIVGCMQGCFPLENVIEGFAFQSEFGASFPMKVELVRD